MRNVRPSPIAGQWYPGTESRLRADIEKYLEPSESTKSFEKIYGLLAPHAGLRFSGPVAGTAFRYLKDRGSHYDIVVVTGPSHYRFSYNLVTTAHDGYQTPLGIVPVAQDVIEQLKKKVNLGAVPNDPEHSIEMEVPFLQMVLKDFQLIPLAILDQSYDMAKKLADALVSILKDKKVLYVASSDLSHFYTQEQAAKLDKAVLDRVEAYDPEGVIRAEEEQKGFACGRAAIAAMMLAARAHGAEKATLTRYATSGDTFGDYSRVVGYGAAIFH